MNNNLLDKNSSFLSRINAYSKERFPLIKQGILILSYFTSNQFVAFTLTKADGPVSLSGNSLLGMLMLICIFFHLRVFDEHKDYEEDILNYPQRILSRGIVSLKELRVLVLFAILIEFAIAYSRGVETLVSLTLVFIFSLLMLKEFFISDWLRNHFLVYALSHILIMPLISLTVFSYATKEYLWNAPPYFILYSVVGLLVSLNWEISRKIRSAEDEIIGVDTYSKILGMNLALALVLLIRFIDTGMVSLLGFHLELPVFFYLMLLALFTVTIGTYIRFFNSPTRENASRLETNAGIYIIGFDIILAIAIAYKYGVIWT